MALAPETEDQQEGNRGVVDDRVAGDQDAQAIDGAQVSEDAVDIAARAGLTLALGERFYTKGPVPCAVEYTGVPGERRGRVETGTEVIVLDTKVHRIRGYSYVAVKIHSQFEDGFGWINICREDIRFVVPITEERPTNPPSWGRSRPY